MAYSPARVEDQDFAVCVDVLVPQTVTLFILVAGSSCMEFGADLVCQRLATRRVVTKVLCVPFWPCVPIPYCTEDLENRLRTIVPVAISAIPSMAGRSRRCPYKNQATSVIRTRPTPDQTA